MSFFENESQPQQETIQQQIAAQVNTLARRREVERQIESLLDTAKKLRLYRRRMWTVRVCWLAFIIFLCYLTHFKIIQFWWLFAMGGGSAAMAERTLSRLREEVHAVIKAGDPCAVGALALMTRERDIFIRQAADRALRRLLPQVKASDAKYINNEQMNALLLLLASSDSEMQVAILKALEQIGDERALVVVEQLATSDLPEVKAEVRDAARACLPYLHAKARLAAERATLLRGTVAPVSPAQPDELLRPTMPTTFNTPSEQLLRATEREAEPSEPHEQREA
ncbi:hypothetical protein CWRG_00301 [Chthonomonas calidirosea]|uniref:hypothetical protein n=1 Tax=Chthonomonas calidirosea TaxID=454171 RepID=UPI0006DD4987|nr:hypothetical protein [Chthonomonas calidirosea]CEK12984.1 hypothetical protein CWRG_00301 [Chthonomonas calidirosea]